MLTKLRFAVAACLSLALAGGVAAASPKQDHQGPRGHKAEMLKKFDANKDGKIDAAEKTQIKDAFKAERIARKAKVLAQFDANKNGKLDDAEKATMRAQRKAAAFKRIDANNDGKITPDEFAAKRGGGRAHGGRKHR